MRPLGGGADKGFHRLGGAADQRFDRAVGAVAHPAVQLVLLRRHGEELAEADALHNAFDPHDQGGNVFAHNASLVAAKPKGLRRSRKPLYPLRAWPISPHSVACGVPRAYRERLSVALGVGLTGLCVGGALGFDAAVAAATGAVCVSISDQPDP